MSEQKSKFPDFNEVIGMATKLFKDVQKSVVEIANEYKEKRKEEPTAAASTAPVAKANATVETPVEKTSKAKTVEEPAPVNSSEPSANATTETDKTDKPA